MGEASSVLRTKIITNKDPIKIDHLILSKLIIADSLVQFGMSESNGP